MTFLVSVWLLYRVYFDQEDEKNKTNSISLREARMLDQDNQTPSFRSWRYDMAEYKSSMNV